ncbi:hypothetical protein K438DRAFT_2111557, partial [Mycena galopus ATCC 62051]
GSTASKRQILFPDALLAPESADLLSVTSAAPALHSHQTVKMCRQKRPKPRGLLARVGYHIGTFFFGEGIEIPQVITFTDDAFPPTGSRYQWAQWSLKNYITLIELAKLDSEPTLERVSYYRCIAPFGHALLLCRLYYPETGPIALALERWGDGCNMASSSPASPADADTVTTSATTSSDSELLKKPHLLYRTMEFPDSSPTLSDLLTLAALVRTQSPFYTLDNMPCVFFAETIYAGLETLFLGRSEEGPNIRSLLPLLMTASNNYETEVQEIVSLFPEGRRKFQWQMVRRMYAPWTKKAPPHTQGEDAKASILAF